MQTGTHSAHGGFSPDDLRATGRALLGLCLLEIALFLAAIGWQKSVHASDMGGLPGVALAAGTLLAAVALLALARAYRGSSATGRRALRLGLTANLAALGLTLAAAEALLRAIALPTQAGLALGPVVVPPTWQETRARNRALLAGARGEREHWLSYVVGDSELGWTIGPSRATPDGLYFSSVEGIRSGRPGVAFAARRPALRIALVGDSHTFSMDGPFEDSWGERLERRLGPEVQVLNFGVDGYGVDQTWLRYRRDVKAWRPDIVLFGFVQHDVQRTVAVYPFLSFGWDYPFAKPRFVVESGALRLVNLPLVTPAAIAALDSASALPFAELDLGYCSGDWRWRAGDPPLVTRLFGAAFPRWRARAPEVSDAAAMDISSRILAAFLAEARSDGAAARILYFPSDGAGDFGRHVPQGQHLARRMLADQRIEHLDLTACVLAVPQGERLIAGFSHYSGRANGAVAGCIAEELAARNWLPAPGARSVAAIAAGDGAGGDRPDRQVIGRTGHMGNTFRLPWQGGSAYAVEADGRAEVTE